MIELAALLSLVAGVGLDIDTRRVRAGGYFTDAHDALSGLVGDFLDENCLAFFELDEDEEDQFDEAVDAYLEFFGLKPKDEVFVIDTIEVEPQGQGLGRQVVEQIEQQLRKRPSTRAIFLQAGDLGQGHSLGFWKAMGFEVIHGEYLYYSDRLMIKVLK